MSYEEVRVERTVKSARFKNVRCDGCGADLQHAVGDHMTDPDGLWQNLQARDALEIKLVGGYGMYFDWWWETPIVLFCKACADKLCEQWPAFAKAVEPEDVT